ncbi:cupin domain-containing protein [Methylomonas sp. AM2-LC]|uniref:cupin domain-containing protein n=1 Tax=Methylomonas sp. AM2-LC TaxID=3153301 RepID=UPI003263C4CF
MTILPSNIFTDIPAALKQELFQTLLSTPTLKIERIVSKGHNNPSDFWYEQSQDEWVLILQGQARLQFSDQHYVELATGDYLLIPAHCRHRVDWTIADIETVWLAIHITNS